MDYIEKKILAIKFGSFLKIIISAFFSLGLFGGILGCIASLLGWGASFYLGDTVLTGPAAAIPLLIFFPLIFSLMGLMFGIFAFLPFKFFLKLKKGLRLRVIEGE